MTAEDVMRDTRKFLKNAPDEILRLALRFPPGCVVRATVPLGIPGPGKEGVVHSYWEDGLVGVLESHPLTGETVAQCDPENLVVVREGLVTRRMVQDVILEAK